MLFNSYIFIFAFLPFTILGYFLLNKLKLYKISEYFLIIMSLIFYGYFNISYLPIIIFSIIFNYFIGKKIIKDNKKYIFVIAIVMNLSVLGYYKYMGFFLENINILFNKDYFVANILLPLGISFFTFQQISYVVDCYKNKINNYCFREYALFVTFFPQLIAGPIVLHNETIPQFNDQTKKSFNHDNFACGLMAFSRGMAKKVIIADTFGNVVNWGYQNISDLSSTLAIFVVISYTIQIYYDFSGYCDMAVGIGKMFNINIPMNFNSPYKALSITEFWKRWHITLTRFLKTYIYIPLGGNRCGLLRTYINLVIVFLVSGLWHGANYTFIVWGMLHGLLIVIERIFSKKLDSIHPTVRWLYTFSFICITFAIFRADNINDAFSIIHQILYFDFTPIPIEIVRLFNFDILNELSYTGGLWHYLNKNIALFIMIFVLLATLTLKNTNEKINSFRPTLISAIYYALLLYYCIICFSGISTFLYFNF